MTFDDLALYVLQNRLSPEESQEIYRDVGWGDPHRMSLLRNIQILSESVYLATTSKKRDTAESRMALVLERYSEISRNQAHLVAAHVRGAIDQVVGRAQDVFSTQLYVNVAEGYVDKAGKLKTAKGQLKYLDLAAEVIQEGIDAGKG
ncbi:MAG: hypothetical protein ACREX3_19095, partial [Gammaproteobacteria bacterium]